MGAVRHIFLIPTISHKHMCARFVVQLENEYALGIECNVTLFAKAEIAQFLLRSPIYVVARWH